LWDLRRYFDAQPGIESPDIESKVFHWDCRNEPRVDPEGLLTFAADCEVQFPVARKKPTTRLHQKKPTTLGKTVESLTSLKRNALRHFRKKPESLTAA